MHVELPSASRRDRFLRLRSLPAFEPLDDEDIQVIAEYSVPRTFEPGTVVTEEGEPHREVFLVFDGRVRISSEGHEVMTVEAPSGFGYLATMSGRKTTLRAETLTYVSTLALPVTVLVETMETNFRFVRNALRLNATGLLQLRANLPVNPGSDYVADPGRPEDHDRTLVEKMLQLTSTRLFADANIDAVIQMARLTKDQTLPADTVLWSIGDVASSMLRVNYGLITCTSADGERVDVGHAFTLGNMDVLANRTRAYEARTKTEAGLSAVDRDDLLTVIESHPDLGMKLLQILASARYEERVRAAKKAGA